MRSKRRITAVEFNTIRPLLKLSDERVEAARAAMVDGETLQALGERYGWTRQAAGDAVSAVWRTLETYRESQRVAASMEVIVPPGWEKVTLIAPTYLIDQFRKEIAQAVPMLIKKTDAEKKSTLSDVENIQPKDDLFSA